MSKLQDKKDTVHNGAFISINQNIVNISLSDSIDKDSIQKIIDSLPYYVLLVDEDHHIIMANKATKSELDVSPKDILGHYCPNVIHGSDVPIHECPLEKSVKSNTPITTEFFDQNYKKWIRSEIYPTEIKTKENKRVYYHIAQDISEMKEFENGLEQSLKKMNKIIDAGIQALIKIVEKRDPYTAGHQQRVAKLASHIATQMNLSQDQIEAVRVAGLLHDIGKVAIPIEILCKPGKISIQEYDMIKTHVLSGYEILKDIEFSLPIAEIVLQHHERLDGTGYPNNLTAENLMIESKILAVADVIEAMTSHRPYRPALGIEKALDEINKHSGVLYDKYVVDECIKLFIEYKYSFE